MKPEAQRIAIAQACGYTDIHVGTFTRWTNTLLGIVKGDKAEKHVQVPDHLNDLNAMHEAEKSLTNEQHQQFRNKLGGVCGFSYNRPSESDPNHHRKYASATAAQRAEAFLRAIGKWTP